MARHSCRLQGGLSMILLLIGTSACSPSRRTRCTCHLDGIHEPPYLALNPSVSPLQPITADPLHLPQLTGSMKHYLWILKITHGGADLDGTLEMAKGALDGDLQCVPATFRVYGLV
jgi:hypothetical protein